MSNSESAARAQVQRSTWRLYLACERCPLDCPFRENCFDNGDGCELLTTMTRLGEMKPRSWESPGWDVLFAERVRNAQVEP